MPKQIKTIIKELRIKAGYESLGELSRVSGISVATLSRIEAGKQEPSPDTLKKLAPPLRVSLDKLMAAAGYLPEKQQPKGDPDPTRAELEELLKRSDVHFNGAPLDDEDIEDVIGFLKLIKKKRKGR